METGKVVKQVQAQTQQVELVLSAEEKKQLADFFAVLIQVDRRVNITGAYGNKANK